MPETQILPSNLTVVISTGQSRNPEKRELEKAIAEGAAELEGVSVVKIPHLYDISPKGESYAALREIPGDLIVITWLFDRAAHWILDRNGVQGQVGEIELKQDFDDEDEEEDSSEADSEERVTNSQPRPDRFVYCLDFRASSNASDFLAEINRILLSRQFDDANADGTPLTLEMLERHAVPQNDTFVGNQSGGDSGSSDGDSGTAEDGNGAAGNKVSETLLGTKGVVSIDEHPGRRWYPVIDFSRCTNCMECIDFCLFGVYGVDKLETIVVEQADNCRKGCPACSRVCPQNAIIFPQHKTPAIAGAPVDTGGMKIDLSKLFGAPETDEDAAEVAARERDEQLILAGREAVSGGTGLQERIAANKQEQPKNDALDGLLDQLDSLDL